MSDEEVEHPDEMPHDQRALPISPDVLTIPADDDVEVVDEPVPEESKGD